jgi:hypothetical protein
MKIVLFSDSCIFIRTNDATDTAAESTESQG